MTTDQMEAVMTLRKALGLGPLGLLAIARKITKRNVDVLSDLSTEEGYRLIDALDRPAKAVEKALGPE